MKESIPSFSRERGCLCDKVDLTSLGEGIQEEKVVLGVTYKICRGNDRTSGFMKNAKRSLGVRMMVIKASFIVFFFYTKMV